MNTRQTDKLSVSILANVLGPVVQRWISANSHAAYVAYNYTQANYKTNYLLITKVRPGGYLLSLL
jgi:hypothetical protein